MIDTHDPSWNLARIALLAAALVTAFLAWRSAEGWDRRREELALVLEIGGLDVRDPWASSRAQRERTPHLADLVVARAIVEDVLAVGKAGAKERPPVEVRAELLPEARRLARRAWGEQPDLWEAAMLLGAATYLERSLARDPRLYTGAADWEAPLLFAAGRSRGSASRRAREPERFLAAAYLELWRALSEEKKARAVEVLRRAFAEPDVLTRLLPTWASQARDVEELMAAIPDRPESLASVERFAARRGAADLLAAVRARRSRTD